MFTKPKKHAVKSISVEPDILTLTPKGNSKP